MSGATLLSLLFGLAVMTPLPVVDHFGTWFDPYVMVDDFDHSRCISFDLPTVRLLEPHLRNRHIAYSWRTLPPEHFGCVD